MSLTSVSMPLRTKVFTAAYDRAGALDVATMTIEQIRETRARVAPTRAPFTWVTGQVPRGVQISSTSFAARDGHLIGVRVYRPVAVSRPSRPLPVVLFFHGGGWVLGSVRGYDPLCGFIADAVPALVLSIDYRLAPEHVAPQAALDCVDALRWTASGAEALGGDPARLAVCGDSAGGNLSAVVSQLVRDEGGPRISHQALLYPGTDATRSFPSITDHADAPVLNRRAIDAFLELYAVPSGLPLDDPLISPLWADDLSRLPPALVQTADLDPLRDEGQAYAARLRAAGVPTRATNYLGTPHGFMSFPGATVTAKQARLELSTELRQHLLASPRTVPSDATDR